MTRWARMRTRSAMTKLSGVCVVALSVLVRKFWKKTCARSGLVEGTCSSSMSGAELQVLEVWPHVACAAAAALRGSKVHALQGMIGTHKVTHNEPGACSVQSSKAGAGSANAYSISLIAAKRCRPHLVPCTPDGQEVQTLVLRQVAPDLQAGHSSAPERVCGALSQLRAAGQRQGFGAVQLHRS